jgi:hypothetical protein
MNSYIENFNGFARAYNAVRESLIAESDMTEEKKVDQDGDGDTDFVDAKVAQYKAGGIRKDIAIAKAKLFAKKNNIKDSKTHQNPNAKSSKRG